MGIPGNRMLCISSGGRLLLLYYPGDYGCGHDVPGNLRACRMLHCWTNTDAAAGRGDSCWRWRGAVSETVQVCSTEAMRSIQGVNNNQGCFTLHSHNSAILEPKVSTPFSPSMTDAGTLPQSAYHVC